MATISSGSVTVTIQPGEQYRVIASGEAYVDIGGGSTESYRLTGATSEKLLGGFIVATRVTIRVVSGSVEYFNMTGVDDVIINTRSISQAAEQTSRVDKILTNNSATNVTVTVNSGTVPEGAVIQQLSTGTCTVVAGAGVTFIGSTLATTTAGQQIAVFKTAIANTYNVKVA